MKSIAANLMGAAVEGLNLSPGNFGDQLGEAGDLLVFLRHLG